MGYPCHRTRLLLSFPLLEKLASVAHTLHLLVPSAPLHVHLPPPPVNPPQMYRRYDGSMRVDTPQIRSLIRPLIRSCDKVTGALQQRPGGEEFDKVVDLRPQWRRLRTLANERNDQMAQLQGGFKRDLISQVCPRRRTFRVPQMDRLVHSLR